MQHLLLGLSTRGMGMAPLGPCSPLWWARGDQSHGNLLWAVWWVEGPCWDGGGLLPHLHRERAAPWTFLFLAPIALPQPALEDLGASGPVSW